MNTHCSICGSYAINIDKDGLLCDVHFYKVQRDELLAALQAVLHDCENLDMVESNEPGRAAGPWLMATNAIAKATGGAA